MGGKFFFDSKACGGTYIYMCQCACLSVHVKGHKNLVGDCSNKILKHRKDNKKKIKQVNKCIDLFHYNCSTRFPLDSPFTYGLQDKN